jgi:hypothetical protein
MRCALVEQLLRLGLLAGCRRSAGIDGVGEIVEREGH